MTTSTREPVTRAGQIAGAVAAIIIALGGLARSVGWLTDDLDVNAIAVQASDLILGAGLLWATVAPAALALWAREKVTPLVDPRDGAGNPLVVEAALPVDRLPVVDTGALRQLEAGDEPGQHATDRLYVDLGPETEPMTAPIPVTSPRLRTFVEPTPIEAETAAAVTGRISAVTA